MRVAGCLLLVAGFGLTACASPSDSNPTTGTVVNLIDSAKITAYKSNQDQYLSMFASIALSNGFSYQEADIQRETANDRPEEMAIVHVVGEKTTWHEIARAGWSFIDAQCQDYLRGLYRQKKQLDGMRRGTAAVRTAANTVFAATSVGSLAIAATAAAFDLAANAFDITEDTLLTALDYNTVFQLVNKTQQAYQGLYTRAGIGTRIEAVNAIQGYLYICEPSSIEANINNKVQSGDLISYLVNAGLMPKPIDEAHRARLAETIDKIRDASRSADEDLFFIATD